MNTFYFLHSLAIGLLMVLSFFMGKSYEKGKVREDGRYIQS
jgi:hypothetical protein